jgi:hypothetical protein
MGYMRAGLVLFGRGPLAGLVVVATKEVVAAGRDAATKSGLGLGEVQPSFLASE